MLEHVVIVKKKDFNKDKSLKLKEYFQPIIPLVFLTKKEVWPETCFSTNSRTHFRCFFISHKKRLLASQCPSVRPHVSTGLPLDRFVSNLIHVTLWELTKKIQIWAEILGTLHVNLSMFIMFTVPQQHDKDRFALGSSPYGSDAPRSYGPLCPTIWYQLRRAPSLYQSSRWPPDLKS